MTDNKLTLEEKILFCSGDRKSGKYANDPKIPDIRMSDGSNGVRPAGKSYPNICLAACSWDRDLLRAMGKNIALDCIEHDVDVLLGPGINIKRTPLCGRNFEYFSEDPYLTGELAAEFVKGLQEYNVAACVKHFCCNNQENGRFSYSSELDEITLREIYLKAFEIVIKKAAPKVLMTSYNRLRGVYTSENPYLYDILRNEWQYSGTVISDWGGVDHRVNAIRAGLDIDMPGANPATGNAVEKAVETGIITEKRLDESIERVYALDKFCKNRKKGKTADGSILKRIAAESIVLLENNGILPLSGREKIAVIGAYAAEPRYQGGGCAHINATSVFIPLDEIKKTAGRVVFCKGFHSETDTPDAALMQEAVQTCRTSDAAVVFVGLSDKIESEGYDRKHLSLPKGQTELLDALCAESRNVIIMAANGAPVDLSAWKNKAAAIVECYYPGQVFGAAAADVLFGRENPSGRLAETFPLKLSDTPSYLSYAGLDKVAYSEGPYVGYRYYTSKNAPTAYPFGYGLSYTDFEYGDCTLSCGRIVGEENITVSFNLKNTGKRFGKEVVQVYLKNCNHNGRPVMGLKQFAKVALGPGEETVVSLEISNDSLKFYQPAEKKFALLDGIYKICICKDAETVICEQDLLINTSPNIHLTRYTTVGEITAFENGPELVEKYMQTYISQLVFGMPDRPIKFDGKRIVGDDFLHNVAMSFQLRVFISLSGGMIDEDGLNGLISVLKKELIR
jgi:beta-glucosidase